MARPGDEALVEPLGFLGAPCRRERGAVPFAAIGIQGELRYDEHATAHIPQRRTGGLIPIGEDAQLPDLLPKARSRLFGIFGTHAQQHHEPAAAGSHNRAIDCHFGLAHPLYHCTHWKRFPSPCTPCCYNSLMIDEIQVQNLALIRDGSIAPSRGLTVLTGETGAGKTALLSALKLLMGARASADMVRDGEESLTVSGRFFGLDAPIQGEDGETVITRRVSADGRSRAQIDGTMAAVHELAELVGPTVDLCGQFEHQQLMRTATHLALLDGWAASEVDTARTRYADAFAEAQAAAAELQRITQSQQLSQARLDDARFVLSRIDEVAPEEGEYDRLKQELAIAENAESLASALARARAQLTDDEGILDKVNDAAAALESVASVDARLASLAAALREAGFTLEDAASQARDYADSIEFDPALLAAQQERFSQLQGLLRAYGPTMADVDARREEAAALVALVDDYDGALAAAQRAQDEAEAALADAADSLDAARREAAPRLASEVSAVMAQLQMGGAQLVCQLERQPREAWTQSGPSRFEFLYKPVADARPRPLARIASGGEVSRVMLALKVVLGAADAVDTLVFDEVDAGVGGAVAVALAEVLAQLACTHQVLVVTHLAQVAVKADTHYVVSREGDETTIAPVAGEAREREVARMLSGSATEASLAHARELLEN